jgi:hypothetical protein
MAVKAPSDFLTNGHPTMKHLFHSLRRAAQAAAWAMVLAGAVWAFGALWLDFPLPWLGQVLACAFAGGALAALIRIRPRRRGKVIAGLAVLAVAAWWLTLQPSNDRNWQPDLAVLAYADMEGSAVTIHNIRNCEYRSETDFDVRHYDKTYDLDKIRTADLYMVYWGSPHMAHTMISFGFEGGDYICFSIETRKEKGEGYSAVKGLYRQFELIYVAADERDLVRLRTNFRQGEEVYLFRLTFSRDQVRTLFLDYLRRMNSLRQKPEWYSALTHNCTTAIRTQRAATDRAPWDWRMLANGHGDKLFYERGMIPTGLPLAELKQKGHINARARAAGNAADFSQRIRKGVPGAEP